MYTTAESFAVNEVLEIIGILERTEDSSEMELDEYVASSFSTF
jgi:hypothetical protein